MRVHLGVVSAVGVCGTHEAAGTNALVLAPVVQVIEVQLLPALALCVVHGLAKASVGTTTGHAVVSNQPLLNVPLPTTQGP